MTEKVSNTVEHLVLIFTTDRDEAEEGHPPSLGKDYLVFLVSEPVLLENMVFLLQEEEWKEK
jgi:hypothetical protein